MSVPTTARPSFHVLGAGSLGLLYAHHLRSASLPVTLLVRDQQAIGQFLVRESMITLERKSNKHPSQGYTECLRVEAEVEAVLPNRGSATNPGSQDAYQHPIQNLLVATKSVDVVAAVRSVQHRLAPDTSVVLLQNGVLAVYQELWREVLSQMDARPHLMVVSTTHGCYVTEPYHVFHAGLGTCTLAEVDASLPSLTDRRHQRMWQAPPSPELQRLMDSLAGLGAGSTDSHAALLRQLLTKLTVNCCINPLTALLGCLNGHLAQDQYAQQVMQQVCHELHQLFGSELGSTEQQLFDAVIKVATDTGNNRSSMLQSVTKGQLTEIEHLNGYAVQQGLEHQVATPFNRSLYLLVKARERLSSRADLQGRHVQQC